MAVRLVVLLLLAACSDSAPSSAPAEQGADEGVEAPGEQPVGGEQDGGTGSDGDTVAGEGEGQPPGPHVGGEGEGEREGPPNTECGGREGTVSCSGEGESEDEPLPAGEGEGEGEDEGAGEGEGEDEPPPLAPVAFEPTAWGPYQVGVREYLWRDEARARGVWSRVWYPAHPRGDGERVSYLNLGIVRIDGQAYDEAGADLSGAPYPTILFSHGFQGISFQSYTLVEHLVSHGFVVIAPNHEGNTLFDFGASDQQVADVARERPADLMYAWDQARALSATEGGELEGVIDLARVGVAGHSFGGFTALFLAGGVVDRDAAVAACEAGVAGDVFCPYIGFWPEGSVVGPPEGAPEVDAVFALAPGGFAAFGQAGLAAVGGPEAGPVLLMGGTVDEYTRNDLLPIYDAVRPPVLKVEIESLGHMGFTDICRIPITPMIPTLNELCNNDQLLDIDRGFQIINTYVTAWAGLYLNDDPGMARWLRNDYAATVPEASTTRR